MLSTDDWIYVGVMVAVVIAIVMAVIAGYAFAAERNEREKKGKKQ